jgi:transposase InsO family protein
MTVGVWHGRGNAGLTLIVRDTFAIRRPKPGLICHSDRRSQYCSIEYQSRVRKHGALIFLAGKGNFFDNAIVKVFFKTLKP